MRRQGASRIRLSFQAVESNLMREIESLRAQLSAADEREREAKLQASREHSKVAGLQVGEASILSSCPSRLPFILLNADFFVAQEKITGSRKECMRLQEEVSSLQQR